MDEPHSFAGCRHRVDSQGLSMDEHVAGLNDDDNPASEEADATADDAIEDERPGGSSISSHESED